MAAKKTKKVLDKVQKKAALYLASNGYTIGAHTRGCLIARVAALVEVGKSSVHRWLKEPLFLQAIEKHQLKFDELADKGLELALTGDAARGVMPNATLIIWWKKQRNPATFDDQLRRDAHRRKHEKEMEALRQNPPEEEGRPAPTFVYRETLPNERIATAATEEDEDLH